MTFDFHPFINSFANSGVFNVLPPQLISLKKKNKKRDKYGVSSWDKMCMDALETIARIQYNENSKLVENYKLVNGEFIPQDYYDCEDCDQYLDPLKELIKEGQIPKFIKHYDIISQPVNKLVNEMAELPATLSVVGKGDPIQSEKEEVETKLLQNYIYSALDQKFNAQLEEQGVDLEQEFESAEEQQQFQQEIQQKKEAMTPPEVKEYMQYSYRHIAELWAEYELEDQKERYNFSKLRREEYRDLLISGRRFRFLGVRNGELLPETWNPLNVFYQKSPDVEYIQDGDYAGRIYAASVPYIIDRFGKQMTVDQIESLEQNFQASTEPFMAQTDLLGNKINYLSNYGVPYNTVLPSTNPSLNAVAREFGQIPQAGNLLNSIYGSSGYTTDFYSSNMSVVTEAFWKSQKKLGRVCWINPETEEKEVMLVDESVILPEYIVELKKYSIDSEPEINTIVWTWVNELREGIKINTYNANSVKSAIYLDVKPSEYQYKSDLDISRVKIPVCGQIINSRNATPKSFVDFQKPLQFIYNIAMNKAVKYFEVSMLPFILMDVNAMPNQKDWGAKEGQSNLEKYFQAGQKSGVLPKDESPSNNPQGSAGAKTEVIDIDMTARILQTFQVAEGIRQMSLSQLGLTPESMGDVKGTDTATGINTSVQKSLLATSHWFTEFMQCEKDIIKMQLDIAQWLQSNNKEITASYVKSDFSQAWLRFNNNQFNLYDLHIYISNSQEELKTLQTYKQLAVELNTVDLPMSARMEMIDMHSPERIKKIIKIAEEDAQRNAQRINDLKQQEIATQDDQEKARLKQDYDLAILKMENDLKEAWITSRGFVSEGEQDLDGSGTPDAFEYEKFLAQSSKDAQAAGINRDRLSFDKEKERQRTLEKQQEMVLKKGDQVLKERQITQSAKNVKVMDKGKYKG